jgi:hypothetical protein
MNARGPSKLFVMATYEKPHWFRLLATAELGRRIYCLSFSHQLNGPTKEGALGVVRGYKEYFPAREPDDASGCWCKEKSHDYILHATLGVGSDYV